MKLCVAYVAPHCRGAGGVVTLADGQTVEYDWLVLALGAETATFGIPGVRQLALPFCTFDDALKARPPWNLLSPEVVL